MKAFTITVSTPKMFNALEYALSVAQGAIQAGDHTDRDAELADRLVGRSLLKIKNHRKAFNIPNTIQYKRIWDGKEDDLIGKRISSALRSWARDFIMDKTAYYNDVSISVLESEEQRILTCLSAAGIYASPHLEAKK